MKRVNAKAVIKITHSKRFQVIEKTWSMLAVEWFGMNHPILPILIKSLHETGKAEVKDDSGTVFFETKDPMYVEVEE